MKDCIVGVFSDFVNNLVSTIIIYIIIINTTTNNPIINIKKMRTFTEDIM